jgi:hypothetical protein
METRNLFCGMFCAVAVQFCFAATLSSGSTDDFIDDDSMVDLGIGIGGAKGTGVGALLFAKGNLIASSSNFKVSTPTVSFRIADYENGEYVAQQRSFPNYALNYTSERDLFKIGVVNSPYYWTNDTNYPIVPSGTHFAGSATEDLVRYAALREANIPDSSRSATNAEWKAVHDNCTQTWVTKNGIDGVLITGAIAAKSRDGQDYSANEVFLPTSGSRYATAIAGRGSWGYYWSSTLHTSGVNYACNFLVFKIDWHTSNDNRNLAYALRPVCPALAE